MSVTSTKNGDQLYCYKDGDWEPFVYLFHTLAPQAVMDGNGITHHVNVGVVIGYFLEDEEQRWIKVDPQMLKNVHYGGEAEE